MKSTDKVFALPGSTTIMEATNIFSNINPAECVVEIEEVHTAVCNFPHGSCGTATYEWLVIPGGERFCIHQSGNYTSQYAGEKKIDAEAADFFDGHKDVIPWKQISWAHHPSENE